MKFIIDICYFLYVFLSTKCYIQPDYYRVVDHAYDAAAATVGSDAVCNVNISDTESETYQTGMCVYRQYSIVYYPWSGTGTHWEAGASQA